MAKVFVGNFPFSVTDDKLREFFSRVGNVLSAKVMTEGEGGRSRGFGFVELSTPEEATAAITELNGVLWEGRQIKVSEDRGMRRRDDGPRPERPAFRRGGDRGDDRQQRDGGYFRAQPLDTGARRKRKMDPFVEDPNLAIDYKDSKMLRRFVSERGKILPRRMTGLTAHNQRQIARAIRRAQHLALISPIGN